jgi:hypothetical protein
MRLTCAPVIAPPPGQLAPRPAVLRTTAAGDDSLQPDRIANWIVSRAGAHLSLNEIEVRDSWSKNRDQSVVYRDLLRQKTGLTWYVVFVNAHGAQPGSAASSSRGFRSSRRDDPLTGGRAASTPPSISRPDLNFLGALDNVTQSGKLAETSSASWELDWPRIASNAATGTPATTTSCNMKATLSRRGRRPSAGDPIGSDITTGRTRSTSHLPVEDRHY